MEPIGTIIVVIGWIVAFVAAVAFLVTAFQESLLWGFGCLLLPIVSLIFLVMYWDKAGKPFLVWLAGLGILFLGSLLS